MNNRIWRQGDLLFEKVDKIPSGFTPSKSSVLLTGEVTGHSHRLENGILYAQDNKYGRAMSNRELLSLRREIFIKVERGGRIVHEEHSTLVLPSGIYKIIYQREYQTVHLPNKWHYLTD